MALLTLVGAEASFQRSFERLFQLFFEEGTIVLSASPEFADDGLTLIFEKKVVGGEPCLQGTLYDGKKKVDSETSDFFPEEQHQGAALKRLMSQLIVKLLERYTGWSQPWGILTGVRPTKLYHSMRRQGMTDSEIKQKLMDEYMVQQDKAELLSQIVGRQLSVVPDLDTLQQEVSIYIGIPFCPTMCAYCTFPAYPINGKNGSVDEFLTGLHYEMEKVGGWLTANDIRVTTIYFGGGTPTSITAEQMDALYEKMHAVFPNTAGVRELTVEAGRPDTITKEKIAVLKKWNVDRISVNPQSFTNETLKAIGRHHSVEETVDKYRLAYESGLTNINMDLIIGLPGEGAAEFTHSLNVTEKLRPASLTVHTLSYKRASPMTKYKEKYKVADREEIHQMMEQARAWMEEHGYVPYYLYRQKNILGNLENIGYALPGQESIYNMMIMEEVQTVIGLGCGASSKWVDPKTGNIDRFANPKDPRSYADRYEEYTERKIQVLNELFA
ncbi:oxygen-independent coproporphyrinogen-3 oxidase [Evansella caseinilytica]|uniref:Oxygen-independent coproporphyrinogen-3 oxidase n=1 Tax=Evansella caseinilytica TaxID=1503961 RepID=A0A1H3K112_9BACI|nr:coproporphyrinogen III oxidase [Evansella caseinilytica]SDY45465.1 oxygen-independent coproporphyrinogen-3 oxidase [Evansella caseinilytica]